MFRKKAKTLQFGNPPPPTGGVATSIKNLVESLREKGVSSCYKYEDTIFSRYDIGHVHASNKLKRLLELLYLRLKCKKVLFTVHGLYFDDVFINRLCLRMSHGVVFLNEKIYCYWKDKTSTPIIILPSMFREAFNENSTKRSSKSVDGRIVVLLYAHSRSFKDGDEVYGIDFALKYLAGQRDRLRVVLVDPSGENRSIFEYYSSSVDVEYYSMPVDFIEFLSEADVYLRPTCMDGASVAVQEALMVGIKVVASNVVERPEGVVTYPHKDGVKMLEAIFVADETRKTFSLRSVHEYLQFVEGV